MLFSQSNETNAWETANSASDAKYYQEVEEFRNEDHLIYESRVRVFYEWDKINKQPKAEIEGEITVLCLSDFIAYYDGLFQDDDIKVDYIYGVNSKDQSYSLQTFKKSYESSSIFHQDGEFVSFALSGDDSETGKVMKYKYQTTYSDLKYLTKLYLQKGHFIKNGLIEIWIPQWMNADIIGFNLDSQFVIQSIEKDVRWAEEYEKTDRGEHKYTVYKFDIKDLDERVSEYRSQGSTYYMPHLLFINKSYDYRGNKKDVFPDLNGLYAWYRSLVKDLNIEPSDEIKQIVDELNAKAKSDEEKLKNIFYWIQDNIRYIAFEDGIAGFKPEEANNVCKNRYGDCKGMANLAKVMLTYSGIDARLTWLGTRHIAYSYDYPTLSVDNHMICTVFLNGKTYYIDATEEYVALDDYATRIQGRQVLIENGDSFLLQVVPEFKAVHNKVIRTKSMRINGKSLVGNANEEHHGESRLNIIRNYNYIENHDKRDALMSFLNDDDKNLNILNLTSSDFSDREDIVKFSYDFSVNNNVIAFDDEIMIQPDFEQEFYNFKFNDRKTNYEFGSKYYLENKVEIEIPKGYRIEHIPSSYKGGIEGFDFEITYEAIGDKVIYSKKIVFEKLVIDKTLFENWNKEMSALQKQYDDYLVLKEIGK